MTPPPVVIPIHPWRRVAYPVALRRWRRNNPALAKAVESRYESTRRKLK